MGNLIPEALKLIGLEVDEEFKIKNDCSTYYISETGHYYEKPQALDRFSYGGYNLLRRLLAHEVEIEKLPFKPKCNERYYNVASVSISCMYWCDSMLDYSFYKLGNCFRTKEEAEANADRIRKEIMNYERRIK